MATPHEHEVAAEVRFGSTGVEGAHAAGVPYIVYSSVSDADHKTGIPHFDSKAVIEERLRSLGEDYSVVAPVFFMENLFAPWVSAGFAHGVLAMGIRPDRPLQVISLPEIAEFATLAIEHPGKLKGRRFNNASGAVTPVEMARGIGEAASVKLAYHQIPIDEVRKQSQDFAKMHEWFDRVGYSADLPNLKGRIRRFTGPRSVLGARARTGGVCYRSRGTPPAIRAT